MSRVHNHMEHRDPTRAQHSRDPKSPTHQQGPQHARGGAHVVPRHIFVDSRLSIPVTWVSRVHTWSPLTAYPLGDKGLAIGFRPSCLISVNAIQIIFTHAGLDAF